MKKKKVSVKNLVILLGILIVAVAAVLPHFAWVLERAHAGAGLATLVQVNVAENNYFLEHHSFTEDWRELDTRFPPDLPGKFAPVSAVSRTRFFQVEESEDGFDFRLELAEDLKGGTVTAQRNGLIAYTLQESFPYPHFSCTGANAAGRWFCKKFNERTDEIMFKPQEKNATSPSENQPEKNRP